MMKTIDDEVDHLETIAGDWASWDDTYFFVQTGSQSYIEQHLTDLKLANLQINFMLFVNTAGEIVHCKYIELKTAHKETCRESIKKYLSHRGAFILRNVGYIKPASR